MENVQVAGAPSQELTNTIVGSQAIAQATGNYAWQNLERRPGENDVQYDSRNSTNFPVTPFPYNSRDTWQQAKDYLASKGPPTMPDPRAHYSIQYGDDDIKYMLDKAQGLARAEFDEWVGTAFDLTNPYDVERLKSIYPEYFTRREQVIDQVSDLQNKVAKLRLRGVTTMEDLQTAYLIDTKQINVPKGAVWDPVSWRGSYPETNTQLYKAGFFSPWKVVGSSDNGRWRGFNPFDALHHGPTFNTSAETGWIPRGNPLRSAQKYQLGVGAPTARVPAEASQGAAQ